MLSICYTPPPPPVAGISFYLDVQCNHIYANLIQMNHVFGQKCWHEVRVDIGIIGDIEYQPTFARLSQQMMFATGLKPNKNKWFSDECISMDAVCLWPQPE